MPSNFIKVGSRLVNLDQVQRVNLDAGSPGKPAVQFYFVGGSERFVGADAEAIREHFDGNIHVIDLTTADEPEPAPTPNGLPADLAAIEAETE